MLKQSTARVERIPPQVWTPEAKLVVPHEDEMMAFASPSFGSNTYKNVGEQILEKISGKNLLVPTGDYAVSLIHAVYCNSEVSEEPEFQDIRHKMQSDWLWVFNGNIFTEKGVYVIQDLEVNGRAQFDISELESKLANEAQGIRFSEDKTIRFALKGTYKFGEHTPKSLAQDGFVRASYGFEGAEKLGEVSAQFNSKSFIYGVTVEEGQSPEQRVSGLDEDDGRLRVSGDDFGAVDRGHAFGVLGVCEADAKK